MKQLLFALMFSASFYTAFAQDFTFGPDYYAMLKKIPDMTQQEFDSAKNTLADGGILYAFLFMKQKYEFLKKTGTTMWKFVALPNGSGFKINKTENGFVVLAKNYNDGGGEQPGGFSKEPILLDARGLLCTYFEVMCK